MIHGASKGALRRRRHATELAYARQRPWMTFSPLTTVMQPLSCLHDQRRKGSCVGQAHGQGIESLTGQRVSCVDLWEGGRIIDGSSDDPDTGTYGESVIQWLEAYGWGDYVTDEDSRSRDEDTDRRVGPGPASAVRSWSRRDRVVLAKTVNLHARASDIAAQVVAALQTPRHYVVLEGGCQLAYFEPPADVVLGPEYRAGTTRGHAERIAGYSEARGAFLIQGSWGSWTWCSLDDGRRVDGCCWVSAEVLAEAWAIDVVRVLA